MTREQAIYKVFMTKSGQEFNDTWNKVQGLDRVEGKVLICTSPGLNRMILRERNITHVSVVKASVKLEGTLDVAGEGQRKNRKDNGDRREVIAVLQKKKLRSS